MNLTRNGKIARLPKAVREELNQRLDDGAQCGPLLKWLNSLPEVQSLLADEFAGRPINKQSLSQWRHGGYAEWLRQQETRAIAQQMIAETSQLQPASAPPLSDQMAGWVTARYLLAVRKQTEQPGTEATELKILHEFCHDLVALRRGDHGAARLKITQARLSRQREKGVSIV
jgi:hypothetical protein